MPNDANHPPLNVHVNLGSRSYEVRVGAGLLDQTGTATQSVLPGRNHAVLLTDSNVGPLYADRVVASLSAAGIRSDVITVQAGEASKSMQVAQQVCSAMAAARLDRKGILVALGGGVIGDLGGFCAAIYQRGIPFVQIPTSVLAQVDSSVGGKTGVNLPEAKNMVGCFHQPSLVLADTETLQSLPKREWNEGFAEIIKHAGIRDAAMFDEIDAVAQGRGDLPALIHRNVAIKARVVEEDETETLGVRALLNFGHTIGHAIEAAAGYGGMLHGEAISLGLRAATWLSVQKSGLAAEDGQRLLHCLAAFDLPLQLPTDFDAMPLLDIAAKDKKFEQGSIRFVLLRALGEAFVSREITAEDMRAAILHLREPV